jgi:hypothetical protein
VSFDHQLKSASTCAVLIRTCNPSRACRTTGPVRAARSPVLPFVLFPVYIRRSTFMSFFAAAHNYFHHGPYPRVLTCFFKGSILSCTDHPHQGKRRYLVDGSQLIITQVPWGFGASVQLGRLQILAGSAMNYAISDEVNQMLGDTSAMDFPTWATLANKTAANRKCPPIRSPTGVERCHLICW